MKQNIVILRSVLPRHIITIIRISRQTSRHAKMRLFKCLLRLSIRYLPFIYSYIELSNETASKQDGTGAQVQRLLSIASLAETIGVRFVQNEIENVTIHPLDPFQTPEKYKEFMYRLNHLFKIFEPDRGTRKVHKVLFVEDLNLTFLFFVALLSYRKKENTRLVIQNPYAVSDLLVDNLEKVVSKLGNLTSDIPLNSGKPFIAIHYRQGVGNFVIYPGQTISREIDVSYFKNCIEKFRNLLPSDNYEVHVFTDAPARSIKYQPPADQVYLWEGTPGFEDGVVEIQAANFNATSLGVSDVTVHSGGDPLDAILFMSRASMLITGRSSLSYLAGIMNRSGIVVSAPHFWHPSPKRWLSAD